MCHMLRCTLGLSAIKFELGQLIRTPDLHRFRLLLRSYVTLYVTLTFDPLTLNISSISAVTWSRYQS